MSPQNSDFDAVGFDDALEIPMTGESATNSVPANAAPSYRKQGFSIYSLMLILSFVFLIASIILLFMEVDRFE